MLPYLDSRGAASDEDHENRFASSGDGCSRSVQTPRVHNLTPFLLTREPETCRCTRHKLVTRFAPSISQSSNMSQRPCPHQREMVFVARRSARNKMRKHDCYRESLVQTPRLKSPHRLLAHCN